MELIEENIQRLFWWMAERHSIYLRRQAGEPWPWTDDPIFQTYKFTNAYRELDRGTVWLREHFIEPYADHPELFFNIALYRRHNWIDTAEELGYIENYNVEYYTALMNARRDRGDKVFTGAHMLCANIKDEDGFASPSKVTQIFGNTFRWLWERRRELEPKAGDTLEAAYDRFVSAVKGYGPFVSYEVITDLRHTRYLDQASDIMTWANPGPGAVRGIVRLMGQEVKDYKSYPKRGECIEAMKVLLNISPECLPDWMPALEIRDVEHALCEMDKYERVFNHEGRPRSKFIPPHLRSGG